MSENDEVEERLTRVEIVLDDLLKDKLRIAKMLEATGKVMTEHDWRIREFDREMQISREKFDREMQESREEFNQRLRNEEIAREKSRAEFDKRLQDLESTREKSREEFEYRLNALIDIQFSRDNDYLKMKNEVADLRQKVSTLENGIN